MQWNGMSPHCTQVEHAQEAHPAPCWMLTNVGKNQCIQEKAGKMAGGCREVGGKTQGDCFRPLKVCSVAAGQKKDELVSVTVPPSSPCASGRAGSLLFSSIVASPFPDDSFFRNEKMKSRKKCGLWCQGKLLAGDV